MIVGSGLIAGAFEREFAGGTGTLVFASGVSNSHEVDPQAFAREERLLRETTARGSMHVVYFSTCSILDTERQQSPYVRHKVAMEDVVRELPAHSIFRLPQVAGRTSNPNTLLNFLRTRIASGDRFVVWKNAWRNIIDIDDVAAIAGHIVRGPGPHRRTMNIASPDGVRVIDLVRMFERLLGVTANYEEIDRGDFYPIDTAEAVRAASELGIQFGPDYAERVLGKYYGRDSVS